LDIGENLMRQFGSLKNLASASIDELTTVRGIGRDKAIGLKSAFTLATRLAQEVQGMAPLLDQPYKVADLLREHVRLLHEENLYLIFLNTRNYLIRYERAGQGTLDSLLIHPREVFKPAIRANASSLIMVHNHPSGDPTPSEADIRVTRDIIRAGQLLRIPLLDHIIIGQKTQDRAHDFSSLRELGYFYE
jgi:DNA repair protein RadC